MKQLALLAAFILGLALTYVAMRAEKTPPAHAQQGSTTPQNSTPTAPAALPSSAEKAVQSPPPRPNTFGLDVSGQWRVYSERMFYDGGGGGAMGKGNFTQLQLDAAGTWTYGSSQGRWSIAEIAPEDWKLWGCDAYRPKHKLVLEGWMNGSASGPIEADEGKVDFVWVIYRVEKTSLGRPATVHVKFGH